MPRQRIEPWNSRAVLWPCLDCGCDVSPGPYPLEERQAVHAQGEQIGQCCLDFPAVGDIAVGSHSSRTAVHATYPSPLPPLWSSKPL